MTTKRKNAPAQVPETGSVAAKKPMPGDWLVYTADQTTLLDFGRDLAKIRTRLQAKNVLLADCFLAREPLDPGDPMSLGAAEIEVY